VPQLLKNVRFATDQVPLEGAHVKAAIAQAEDDLAGKGRLLIRTSGTEPLVRVMAEHEDAGLMEAAVDSVVGAVEDAVNT
jgi:phosphoglucosamine mutase